MFISGQEEFNDDEAQDKRQLLESKPNDAPISIKERIPDQIKAIDYDTYNPFINLGTLSGIILVYIFKLLIYYIYVRPRRTSSKSNKKRY